MYIYSTSKFALRIWFEVRTTFLLGSRNQHAECFRDEVEALLTLLEELSRNAKLLTRRAQAKR